MSARTAAEAASAIAGPALRFVLDGKPGKARELLSRYDSEAVSTLGAAAAALTEECRKALAEPAAAGSVAQPEAHGDWSPEVAAWMAQTATCRHCGDKLVRSPSVLGLWLTDRKGTGRGLCSDGSGRMHVAEAARD